MKILTHRNTKFPGNGFTIVELLVAMAVSALLMLMLVSIVSKSTDTAKRANTGMLSKSSAQAALDLLVTDLDSLVVNRNAQEVFRYTNMSVSNVPLLTNSTIYCLTTSMEDSYSTNNTGSAGMPRLVQYVIKYTNSYASTNPCFGLIRDVMDPTNTFSNVTASTSQLDTNWSNYAINTNTTINTPNTYNYLLVPNAVGMNVAMYTNFGSGIWTNALGTNTSISSTNFPRGVLLEISLTVLDEPALSRYTNAVINGGVGNNSASNLVTQFGRTLVRRVLLPSPP